MIQAAAPGNLLLAALAPDDLVRLAPYLEPLELEPGTVLLEPGAAVERVWFPEGGVVALGAVVREGTVAGIAIGWEGAVGVVEALGSRLALARSVVLVPGRPRSLPLGPLLAAAEASRAVRRLCERYVEALTADALRSASCNVRHPAGARLARWLLHLQDRAGDGVPEAPTEAFLAAMTRLPRAAVAERLRELERVGLVERRRGTVETLDRAGLETAACDCYGAIRGFYERLLPSPPG
jgi:CRP-like cAMP-binding protein